jgi:hypothetical protein
LYFTDIVISAYNQAIRTDGHYTAAGGKMKQQRGDGGQAHENGTGQLMTPVPYSHCGYSLLIVRVS